VGRSWRVERCVKAKPHDHRREGASGRQKLKGGKAAITNNDKLAIW
jgi:hypothetical protein